MEIQMSDVNKTKTILIKAGTPLSATLSIESEEFMPGWRVVKNIDRDDALSRKIEDANWNFFYLAGELKATVLGRDRPGTLRKAVKGLLAKQQGQIFNCLEITKVVSKRFLGIPFMRVIANSRQIQESIYLVHVKELVLRLPVAAAPTTGLDNTEQQHHGEVATRRSAAVSLSI
jgi:hypothetical protein